MLEKQLASTFNRLLENYRILTMTTKQGGLPDKGVQLNNSRVIWFERKLIALRPGQPSLLFQISKIIKLHGLVSGKSTTEIVTFSSEWIVRSIKLLLMVFGNAPDGRIG